MTSITTVITLEIIHAWEVRHLCLGCQDVMASRQPDLIVQELGVSSVSMQGLYCGNCGRAAGDSCLATGRIYITALGTPRTPTPSEQAYFTRQIGIIERACINRHEKRFLAAIDRIYGLLVPRIHTCQDLTPSQQARLIPAGLKTDIDNFDAVYFGA